MRYSSDASSNKEIIKTILFNIVETVGAFNIAQIFSRFFSQIATNLKSNIPACTLDPLTSGP